MPKAGIPLGKLKLNEVALYKDESEIVYSRIALNLLTNIGYNHDLGFQ